MLSDHILLTFLIYFPIYAFLGWCLEVAYASVTTGKFVNRGFLNGAICPIYGCGAVLLIVCLTPLTTCLPLLFLASICIASSLELIGGYLLKKLFHMRWWDYSKEPLNIGGFICLKFSIIWGMIGVVLMTIIHPFITGLVAHLPTLPIIIFISLYFSILLLDTGITVIAILHLNKDLKQVHELSRLMRSSSDSLAEDIGNLAIDASKKLDTQKEKLSDTLSKQLDDLLTHQTYVRNRLFKAFPNIKHDTAHHELNVIRKQYELSKKKTNNK